MRDVSSERFVNNSRHARRLISPHETADVTSGSEFPEKSTALQMRFLSRCSVDQKVTKAFRGLLTKPRALVSSCVGFFPLLHRNGLFISSLSLFSFLRFVSSQGLVLLYYWKSHNLLTICTSNDLFYWPCYQFVDITSWIKSVLIFFCFFSFLLFLFFWFWQLVCMFYNASFTRLKFFLTYSFITETGSN